MTTSADRRSGIGRPDVYLMAFACEPGRGSEPGVGFAIAQAAARLARQRGHRITLVTRPHRVVQIREALGDDASYLRIMPVQLPAPVWRLTGRRYGRPAAVLWQYLAVRRVRAELRTLGRPAVVHHVTFATEALPTFERSLRKYAAVVFGPAGSTSVSGQGLGVRLRRGLRSLIARRTLGTADLLLAQNEDVRRSWSRFGIETVTEPNVVIEPLHGERPPIAWAAAAAGVLTERKRFDIAIEAFAASGSTGRMIVMGEGPELSHLQSVASRTGVGDRVDFVGSLPRVDVLDRLSRSAVMLHPSRQEGASWAVGEAQSVGTAPVVFAGSGTDDLVRSAGIGYVVESAEHGGYAAMLRTALDAPRALPSARWSADRLPDLLERWYARALLVAAGRR